MLLTLSIYVMRYEYDDAFLAQLLILHIDNIIYIYFVFIGT